MLVLLAVMAEQSADARKSLPPARCEELLAGIAQGDADAFAQLYRATDRMLYAYALSLTRSHHNAQDVMMETYLKIRAGAHLYRPMGKPLAWIFTIARSFRPAYGGSGGAYGGAPRIRLR